MFSINKRISAALVAFMLSAPMAASAGSSVQDDVRDARGQAVMDKWGGCVRTKWMVDSSQCEGFKVAREARTVYFDFNRSTLTAEAKKKLDALIKIIVDSKRVASVDIVGHADKIGTSSYNSKLSMRRAQAVKQYIQSKSKIPTRNIEVRALGEGRPVTKCDGTKSRKELIACLWEDRRVEIMLNLEK